MAIDVAVYIVGKIVEEHQPVTKLKIFPTFRSERGQAMPLTPV